MINMTVKDNKTVQLEMSDEVTADDYKMVKPKLEALFEKHGKMKFLIDLNQVKKFTLGALYQDIKFDLGHLKSIGTTAIVSSQKTYEYITKFIDKVYPEKVEHFDERASADKWLTAQ